MFFKAREWSLSESFSRFSISLFELISTKIPPKNIFVQIENIWWHENLSLAFRFNILALKMSVGCKMVRNNLCYVCCFVTMLSSKHALYYLVHRTDGFSPHKNYGDFKWILRFIIVTDRRVLYLWTITRTGNRVKRLFGWQGEEKSKHGTTHATNEIYMGSSGRKRAFSVRNKVIDRKAPIPVIQFNGNFCFIHAFCF